MSKLYKMVKTSDAMRYIEVKVPERESSTDAIRELSADELMENARREAEAMQKLMSDEYAAFKEKLANEEADWEAGHKQAREQAEQSGYLDGFAKGEAEAREQWEKTLNDARRMIQMAEDDYQKYLESAEKDILELALAVAEKIIGQALEEKPDRWISLVQTAIKEVQGQSPIKIIVPPDWYEQTVQAKDLLQTVTQAARLAIFPDEKLAKDACLIETPIGRIEASIDSQLKVIKQKLSELLEVDEA